MYENIAKIIFDYTVKGKIADENFVKKIVEIISEKQNLYDYIKKLVLNSKNNSYNFDSKILEIDINNKLKRFNFLFINNSILLINFNLALTIFHEMDHIRLKKSVELNEKTIDVEYANILLNIQEDEVMQITDNDYENLSKKDQNEIDIKILNEILDVSKKLLYYNLYHDNVPQERRANINSHIDLNRIMDILYDTSLSNGELNKIRLIELKNFIKVCRSGYDTYYYKFTNSPSYDYIKKLQMENELPKITVYDANPVIAYNNAKNSYTLQERILYGLPLTVEELKEINMNSNPFHVYKKIYNRSLYRLR